MSNYSKEAQELAYAWEATKTPLEAIAENFLKMGEQLLKLKKESE